jgi:GxxExxY protein
MERKSAILQNSQKEHFREPSDELNRLSHLVIGAAIAVHRELGPGFLEATYEEALALELAAQRVPFQRQLVLPVFYREQPIAEGRLDFLVDEQLVIELKAVEELRRSIVRRSSRTCALDASTWAS